MKIVKFSTTFLIGVIILSKVIIMFRNDFGITVRGIIHIILPLVLLLALNIRRPISWLILVCFFLLGLFDLLYRPGSYDGFSYMVITEPVFRLFCNDRTGSWMAYILLKLPLFIYIIALPFLFTNPVFRYYHFKNKKARLAK